MSACDQGCGAPERLPAGLKLLYMEGGGGGFMAAELDREWPLCEGGFMVEREERSRCGRERGFVDRC
jgi:hypothetical protein